MKPMIRMRSSIAVAVVAAGLGVLAVRPPTSHGTIIRTADSIEPMVVEEGGWPTTTTSTTAEAPVVSPTTTAAAPLVVVPKPRPVLTTAVNSSTPSKDGVNCEESGCEGPDDFIWSRGTDGDCRKIGKTQAEKWGVKEDSTCPGPAATTTTTSAAPETNGTPANDDSTTTTQP